MAPKLTSQKGPTAPFSKVEPTLGLTRQHRGLAGNVTSGSMRQPTSPACARGDTVCGELPAFAREGTVRGVFPACAGGDTVRGFPTAYAEGGTAGGMPPACAGGDSACDGGEVNNDRVQLLGEPTALPLAKIYVGSGPTAPLPKKLLGCASGEGPTASPSTADPRAPKLTSQKGPTAPFSKVEPTSGVTRQHRGLAGNETSGSMRQPTSGSAHLSPGRGPTAPLLGDPAAQKSTAPPAHDTSKGVGGDDEASPVRSCESRRQSKKQKARRKKKRSETLHTIANIGQERELPTASSLTDPPRVFNPLVSELHALRLTSQGRGSQTEVTVGGKMADVQCAYYMRTGRCAFGSACKFTHPTRHYATDGTAEPSPRSEGKQMKFKAVAGKGRRLATLSPSKNNVNVEVENKKPLGGTTRLLKDWPVAAETIPRKGCAREGCNKRALFRCSRDNIPLCSKSCQHRRQDWINEDAPSLTKGTGRWCNGKHTTANPTSPKPRCTVRCSVCKAHFCTRKCLQDPRNVGRHFDHCKVSTMNEVNEGPC